MGAQLVNSPVVPIAKVAYGFGAGGGRHGAESSHQGEGGGGGVKAFPAGALEITATGTRFIPFADPRPLAAAFALGVAFASLMLGRRRRPD